MIHTFKGLRDEVLRLLDEAGDTSTTRDLVKDFVNQAHQQRCTEFPWWFMLWPRAETFSTVIGLHQYSLHSEFHRPLYFFNRTTKQYLIELPNRSVPPSGVRWNDDTGHATHFSFWIFQPVLEQPSSPSVITIVSDNPLDVGASYDVLIKGENAKGNIVAEKLTPTGTAPVTGSIQFRTILAITRAGGWNGVMTITAESGETLMIDELGACEMGRAYRHIWIHEIPPSTNHDTIEYRFYRQPLFLVNDYDIPDIPAPHAQLLVWDSLVMMSGYLTEANPQTLQIWKERQFEAQMSLYRAYGTEGQSMEAMPQFVRPYLNDYDMIY